MMMNWFVFGCFCLFDIGCSTSGWSCWWCYCVCMLLSVDAGLLVGLLLVWVTWLLFVGLGLLLVGVGLFVIVVGVWVELNGYSNVVIGLFGVVYYGGFLVGLKVIIAAFGWVGYIRVYIALVLLLLVIMIVMGLCSWVVVWFVLRFVSGMCIVGFYVVVESWLN